MSVHLDRVAQFSCHQDHVNRSMRDLARTGIRSSFSVGRVDSCTAMKRGTWLKFALVYVGAMSLGTAVVAQTPPDHCWVKYSYDPAGNRIKREWWCGDPGGTDENGTPRSHTVNTIGVRAYPNPADQALELVTDTAIQEGEAVVRDEQGRVVLRQRIQGFRTQFDLSDLANGLYLLELKVAEVEYSTKFTVAH